MDSAQARRESLECHLASLGVHHYKRFPAVCPSQDERLRGLKSLGELGIWLSTLELLLKISTQVGAPVVNILEDDFRFSQRSHSLLIQIAGEMHSGSCTDQDIIFLDYFIDDELFQLQLHEYNDSPTFQCSSPPSLRIDGNSYLACTSSYLIKRSFAHKLLYLLLVVFSQSNKLPPIDLAIRQLIRQKLLRVNLVMPPLGCPDWEQDRTSSIQTLIGQTNEWAHLRDSQRIYLLLRLACSGIRSPSWCCMQLRSVLDMEPPIAPEESMLSLLNFFKGVKPRLRAF